MAGETEACGRSGSCGRTVQVVAGDRRPGCTRHRGTSSIVPTHRPQSPSRDAPRWPHRHRKPQGGARSRLLRERSERASAGGRPRGTRALGSNDTRTWIEGQARGEEECAHLYGGIRGDRSIDPRLDDRDTRTWLEGYAHFHGETRGDRWIQVRTWIEGQARGADGSAEIDGSIPALAWIQARSGRRDTRGSMDPSARIDRTICACPVTPSAQGSS